MRGFKAYTLEDWPRRKGGDLIFQSTEEAFYYARLIDDRLAASELLKKWRAKTLMDIKGARGKKTVNYNRLFDLAVRAQFYRECMEEIQRLNLEGEGESGGD